LDCLSGKEFIRPIQPTARAFIHSSRSLILADHFYDIYVAIRCGAGFISFPLQLSDKPYCSVLTNECNDMRGF